jgi:hypothetical protein
MPDTYPQRIRGQGQTDTRRDATAGHQLTRSVATMSYNAKRTDGTGFEPARRFRVNTLSRQGVQQPLIGTNAPLQHLAKHASSGQQAETLPNFAPQRIPNVSNRHLRAVARDDAQTVILAFKSQRVEPVGGAA